MSSSSGFYTKHQQTKPKVVSGQLVMSASFKRDALATPPGETAGGGSLGLKQLLEAFPQSGWRGLSDGCLGFGKRNRKRANHKDDSVAELKRTCF